MTTLLNIKPGENKLIKVQEEDDILQLAIYCTTIKIKDKLIYLVTIKDIQNVLEEQETEAWQKLIRVLTHEIMNSITPIASLSSTLDLMVKEVADVNGGGIGPFDKDSVLRSGKPSRRSARGVQVCCISLILTGTLHVFRKPNFRLFRFLNCSIILPNCWKTNSTRCSV